jgi:hypothetical protein
MNFIFINFAFLKTIKNHIMKIFFTILLLSIFLSISALSQTTILNTSFEGPGFDEGWTTGVSQAITETPEDYPAGLQPWEEWSLTDDAGFGYVHSGDSAAWIGGTLYLENTHDWLMTPQITVPNEDETLIYYWLWYHSEYTYVNKFYIMIYDCDNSTWEQGYLLENAFNSPLHYVEEYTFDLAPWKGKNIKIAFVKNGTYQMAMDDIRVICNPTSGISDIVNTQVAIYPNPAKNIINIKLEKIPLDNRLQITDISGKTMLLKTITSNTTEIDISSLKSGIYFVRIGNITKKLMVEH